MSKLRKLSGLSRHIFEKNFKDIFGSAPKEWFHEQLRKRIIGNFVNRAMVLTQKYFDSKVPACAELTDYDKETLKEFADVKAEVEKNNSLVKLK